MEKFRVEKDIIGSREIPKDAYWGINTLRALENFSVSERRVPNELIHAYGEVKLACARINMKLNYLSNVMGKPIEIAANELARGVLDKYIIIDAFQGGAGTSTNMNVNEVIANRALVLMNKNPGEYDFCDPILHVNMHQSTNDTYPTALKIAIFRKLLELEKKVVGIQEICQQKEKEFSNILKIGRTELMDAVPMTLGMTFGAWAEVLSRDRWRIFKATERIKVINLGGTAIGTGICAPREYIFQVTEELKNITGLPLARAENLVDNTQNLDPINEIMGIIKTHALNLMKIANDLRLMNMGPDSGIHEIELPVAQIGSTIMPYKFNPVIPEMIMQVAMQICGMEQTISWAIGYGQLELNAFMPVVALNVLEALELLIKTNEIAAQKCLAGIKVNELKCREDFHNSRAMTTLLIPYIGYHKASEIASLMHREKISLKEATRKIADIQEELLDEICSPQAINALGYIKRKDKN